MRLRSEKDLGAMDVDSLIAAATKAVAERADGYGFDDIQ